MAGDWIKWVKGTATKPEVFRIADQLYLDARIVPTLCLMVWEWADANTTDGNARGATLALIDRITGVAGFGLAMEKAGWVLADADGLIFPNFDRHNGETAKRRAMHQQRQEKYRASHPDK